MVRGEARQGRAWPGAARHGVVPGAAWQGEARLGKAWFMAKKIKGGWEMDRNKRAEIINSAVQSISSMGFGTTITHLAMEKFVGIKRQEEPQRYYGMVRSMREILMREYGVFLETEPKTGYVISRPGEEVDLCLGDFLSGARRMGKAVQKAQNIRVDRIEDDIKRAATIHKSQKMANVLGMLKQSEPMLNRKDSLELTA
jgi:hypothetical protein